MDKIRKGDVVIVIAGKDKGRRGSVLARVAEDLLLVEGVNQVKKHVKPDPAKGIMGGVVDKNMPLHVSNVALYNPETKKAGRVGFMLAGGGGKKVRVFKSNGKVVGK